MSVIALDLGGTKLAGALFNGDGNIFLKTKSSLEKRNGTDVGKLISRQVDELLNKAIAINEKVSAIGICVPGIAHARTGKVWAPNIPGWDDYPLLEEMKQMVKD